MFFQKQNGQKRVYHKEEAIHDVFDYAFSIAKDYKDLMVYGNPPIVSGETNKHDMNILADIIYDNGNLNYVLAHYHRTMSSNNTIRVKVEHYKGTKGEKQGERRLTEIDDLMNRVSTGFSTSEFYKYILQVWIKSSFFDDIHDIIKTTAVANKVDGREILYAKDIHDIAVKYVIPQLDYNICNMYRVNTVDWVNCYTKNKDRLNYKGQPYVDINRVGRNGVFAAIRYWLLLDVGDDIDVIKHTSGSRRPKNELAWREQYNNDVVQWIVE